MQMVVSTLCSLLRTPIGVKTGNGFWGMVRKAEEPSQPKPQWPCLEEGCNKMLDQETTVWIYDGVRHWAYCAKHAEWHEAQTPPNPDYGATKVPNLRILCIQRGLLDLSQKKLKVDLVNGLYEDDRQRRFRNKGDGKGTFRNPC